MENKIINKLQYISTWKLIGFAILTLGVYPAHYIKRQTKLINEQSEENEKISASFINLIVFIAYLYMGIIIANIVITEYIEPSSNPVYPYSYTVWTLVVNILSWLFYIIYMTWSFKARNRMNRILSAQRKEKEWFHGFWSIIFVNYYFNFKINKLKEFNDLKSEMT